MKEGEAEEIKEVTVKLVRGGIREVIMGEGDIKEQLNMEVKIGIEKAQASTGFVESIPQMVLCGTDDQVPGIKNQGKISVIEAGS